MEALRSNYGIRVEPSAVDYIDRDITEAFDWASIVSQAKAVKNLEAQPLYLVVFRSQLKLGADVLTLLEHDARAHEAAQESPDLLHYFGGVPDVNGRALSFCLWADEDAARSISRDSRHREATQMVSQYESYSLERYSVHHEGEIEFVAR